MEEFAIRFTRPDDLNEVMAIYAHARAFMAQQGNPRQWGPTHWPPRSLIEQDVEEHKSYVAQLADGRVAAVFFYDYGRDIEPAYARIDDGSWLCNEPYGVVHRIASAQLVAGAGEACLRWAIARNPHVRIDTHAANIPMQRLLAKLGFRQRGIIYVHEDNDPRIAFEHI